MHLLHIEDLAFHNKANEAIDIINRIINHEFDEIQVNLKIDGSPAILFGVDDHGLFVGLKSAITQTNRLYTISNINSSKYSDELKKILVRTLSLIAYIAPFLDKGRIYHGDIIFVSNYFEWTGDLAFQPNTLTYKIAGSVFDAPYPIMGCIVVHTCYTLTSAGTYEASNISSYLPFENHENGQLILSNFIHDPSTVIGKKITIPTPEFNKIDNMFVVPVEIQKFLIRYYNSTIKSSTFVSDINSSALIDFILDERNKHVANLRTRSAQQRVSEQYNELIQHVVDNCKQYEDLFLLHKQIQDAKNNILVSVTHKLPNIECFLDGDPIMGEGLVITDTKKDLQVKLVNRQVFSKKNFERHQELVSGK